MKLLFVFSRYILLWLLCFHKIIFSGFAAETLIKVRDRYAVIANLESSDKITTFHIKSKQQGSRSIGALIQRQVSEYVVLLAGDELIICSKNQLFYSLSRKSWIQARDVERNEKLLRIGAEPALIMYAELVCDTIDVYDIRVDDQHCYCITSQDIVVHNFGIFIGLSCFFGSGVSFQGCTFGLSVFGVWLGARFFQKKDVVKIAPQLCAGGCPNPCPDPEDDEEKRKEFMPVMMLLIIIIIAVVVSKEEKALVLKMVKQP